MLPTPTSTYRLQLNHTFTFDDASRVAGYLKDLGVSHVYCSPYLQAAKGSMHGYDVVDHQKVNVEIGGEEGHARFCGTLKSLELGQVLDIVPNHMATGPENKYWWDVLENGPASRFAEWFDIDWNSAEVKLQNKVLIPVLGDQYGRALSNFEISIRYDGESFQVCYGDHHFPLAPRSLATLLSTAARYVNAPMLGFLADSLSRLPAPESTDEGVLTALHRDKTILYDLLLRFCKEHPESSAAISRTVEELNRNIEGLDSLLNLQNYRLAYWRTADQELGYRRFFDVNSLVGMRVERPRVFNAIHSRVLEWLRDGTLDGVRVDHPDGLRDPGQYFERLRSGSPGAWILAEKILQPGESLRPNWPIAGTTGYDFLNMCNGVLIYDEGLRELTDIYGNFTGEPLDFECLARSKKMNVEHEALGSDVNRLAHLLVDICENNRDRRDYTRAEIRRAIREVAASFSVYRSYVVPGRNEIVEEDEREIRNAVEIAKTHRTDIAPDLFDFIGDVLSLRSRGEIETEFLLRFQQFTSPVMAKGLEDTAFYCYNRLVGMNEVGGSPERGGVSLEEFHSWCARLQADYPKSMNTLSTHDTKRADDVRSRLAVITELPGRWRAAVNRWARKNRQFKTGQFPDRNTEYLLYQTLVGSWPIETERVTAYMEKAAREAKQQTSWTQQNKDFEDALKLFIERILDSREFVEDLEDFVAHVLEPGRINGLSQTLVKSMAPGIPDLYQGGELWDLRLVDPDNRGPIDYETRQTMLHNLQAGMSAEEIMKNMDSGMPKLWLLYKAMQLRKDHPEWFGEGASYTPLRAEGSKQAHLIAFCRSERVAVLGPRWNLRLGNGFGSTTVELPEGRWTNLLTSDETDGGTIRVQTLLQRFPVALLVRNAGESNASV